MNENNYFKIDFDSQSSACCLRIEISQICFHFSSIFQLINIIGKKNSILSFFNHDII